MKKLKVYEVNYETVSKFDASDCNASCYVRASTQSEAIRLAVTKLGINPAKVNGAWELVTIPTRGNKYEE